MSEFVLHAEVREKSSKDLRKNGVVPGVFYARGEKNMNIQVPRVSLNPLIYTSQTHIIDLRLNEGSSKKCILRDVQFDPVTDKPIHFDLQGLQEHEKLTLDVPVVLKGGTPVGVREGGMLQHMIHKLKISCMPKDIPEKIEIDVSGLQINHFIHVRDVSVPNITVLENMDSPVVGVLPPIIEKVAEAAPVEEPIMEPEVLTKGKKTEEGEGEEEPKEKPKEK